MLITRVFQLKYADTSNTSVATSVSIDLINISGAFVNTIVFSPVCCVSLATVSCSDIKVLYGIVKYAMI